MDRSDQQPRIVSAEESRIKLSERGLWFHEGEPFKNKKIIEFFHRAIRKDAGGRYYLHNTFEPFERLDGKQEQVYFEVEDTAYFVMHLTLHTGADRLRGVLNTGAAVDIDAHTLEQDPRGVMYCRVLDHDRARLTLNALHDLADLAEENDRGIYLDLAGERIYICIGR